jgi:hypothetical protein
VLHGAELALLVLSLSLMPPQPPDSNPNNPNLQELVLALSRHAAWCYAKAGRVRSSALIYADVAVLALQRGQLDAAAR